MIPCPALLHSESELSHYWRSGVWKHFVGHSVWVRSVEREKDQGKRTQYTWLLLCFLCCLLSWPSCLHCPCFTFLSFSTICLLIFCDCLHCNISRTPGTNLPVCFCVKANSEGMSQPLHENYVSAKCVDDLFCIQVKTTRDVTRVSCRQVSFISVNVCASSFSSVFIVKQVFQTSNCMLQHSGRRTSESSGRHASGGSGKHSTRPASSQPAPDQQSDAKQARPDNANKVMISNPVSISPASFCGKIWLTATTVLQLNLLLSCLSVSPNTRKVDPPVCLFFHCSKKAQFIWKDSNGKDSRIVWFARNWVVFLFLGHDHELVNRWLHEETVAQGEERDDIAWRQKPDDCVGSRQEKMDQHGRWRGRAGSKQTAASEGLRLDGWVAFFVSLGWYITCQLSSVVTELFKWRKQALRLSVNLWCLQAPHLPADLRAWHRQVLRALVPPSPTGSPDRKPEVWTPLSLVNLPFLLLIFIWWILAHSPAPAHCESVDRYEKQLRWRTGWKQ